MNFNSLVNKLQILEEARAGRFEKLFQTGYLKKAIEDKKIGVARPLVFEFIINFLKDKGMVPEGTAFAGSRYAAEAGEFIKNLVDSGVVKDEIADEFKQYMNENLGKFVQLKQQVRSRGKGENIGKTFGSSEEFGQFGKVKTAEEMAAEKQAKKDAEKAAAEDISPTSPYEFKDYQVNIETKNDVSFDLKKINRIFTALAKGTPVEVDIDSTPTTITISMDPESPVAKSIVKFGEEKVNGEIENLLAKQFGVDPDDIMVTISPPHIMDIDKEVGDAKPKTKSMRSGVDTQGYGMGTIAPDDSARRLSNPFEDEEEIVKENAKPVVKFVANKDMKAKTYWQKMAQQEMYYR